MPAADHAAPPAPPAASPASAADHAASPAPPAAAAEYAASPATAAHRAAASPADPLTDPAYTVPAPGARGPVATMAWLRASVSRFAEGEAHVRRRALVEARLRDLDPAALRAAAATERDAEPAYVPVAVLARVLGARDVPAAVAAVRVVAAAYHPGTDAPGADAALRTLLPLGVDAITLLVQACESTAAMVRGDETPVKVTRRVAPDGRVVEIDLTGRPFGAGPRACPGREHALALVEGVLGR